MTVTLFTSLKPNGSPFCLSWSQYAKPINKSSKHVLTTRWSMNANRIDGVQITSSNLSCRSLIPVHGVQRGLSGQRTRSFQTLTLDDNLLDLDFICSIIIHFEIFIFPKTGFQIGVGLSDWWRASSNQHQFETLSVCYILLHLLDFFVDFDSIIAETQFVVARWCQQFGASEHLRSVNHEK